MPDTSAMLDVSSTTTGFLMPRMTTTEQNAIVLPASGLAIFNTTVNSVMLNTGTPLSPNWSALGISANAWSITGNSGINPVTNFLGTTDNKSVRFRTNNTQRMKIDSLGNVVIGQDVFDVTNPEKFVVNAETTSSVNAIVAKGSIDSYLQFNIKNQSTGTNATTDIVATADNGSETTNYVDLGINGSNYAGGTLETGVANDGYLISAAKDFYLVNSATNRNMIFLTGGAGAANERMRILANGRVGMGVQDPTAPFVVKDTMEIRRVGSLSQLLFTNTAGSGDFRIGGDGGDIFWQGGGGRGLQMGSYWTTILTGDRQTSSYPSFISTPNGTGVLVLSQRNASVPLGIQAYSGSQTANLTEWRNSSNTVLSAVDKDGNLGAGTSTPSAKLDANGTFKLGSAGTVLNNIIKTNVTVGDATTFNYTQTKTYTATVTGATVNGTVIVNPRSALPTGISIGWARVSASNTVTIAFTNTDGTSRAIGSSTFDVTIIQ